MKASKGNQRTVFSVVNKVLHKRQTVLSNIINSDKDMAHCCNHILFQKILNIHSGYPSNTLSHGSHWQKSPAYPLWIHLNILHVILVSDSC